MNWTIDDIVLAEQASDFRIAPDGRRCAWVKSAADPEKDERVTHVMISSLAERRELQLTRGIDSCNTPRWSPDGERLAFLTTRHPPRATPPPPDDEPKCQVWLLAAAGGEAWPLTEMSRGVRAYDWANPGSVVFAAQEDRSLYETMHKERKEKSRVVEDEAHEPPARLYRADVESRRVTRLSDNTDRIQSLAASPDGRYAVTIHERSLRFTYDHLTRPIVFLYDLNSGDRRPIFARPEFFIRHVRWAPDSSGFYATHAHSRHPRYLMATITELYYFDLASGREEKVDLDWPNGLASALSPVPDGFMALLANGARNLAVRYVHRGGGWRREELEGEHVANLVGLEASRDGRAIVYGYSTASTPTQWFTAALEGPRLGPPLAITALNPGYAKKPPPRSEVVRWRGALDEEVEGILSYPQDYHAGERYPLVVSIHGGPAGVDLDAWADSWTSPRSLLTGRGAFVLRPNYHGSSNYGLDWVESIAAGNYYDLEVPDIERGVDSLIDRGLADPHHLGVMGWSNGGVLTIALTVETDRYRVASAGAGDVDWVSDWANAHFGAAFDNYYLGKSPIEDPDLYHRKSPFYRMDRVRTPTIIFFGTEDTNVPTQQGWMHYRALQQHSQAEARFVLFPGEEHGLKKLSHQRRKLEEELAWFDRHLFGTAKAGNEAVKSGSLLAAALHVRRVAREGERFGRLAGGRLVPETVTHQGLEIGRFEVTRAQFAEFDAAYPVPPGTENFPANGIDFERARDYCRWLAQVSGEPFRLGSEQEMAPIYAAPAAVENTLDYWAGYAVNADDAQRLGEAARELGGDAPLLKRVGSMAGAGEEPLVYDLGGNLGEWVAGDQGGGVLLGGSADTAVDGQRGPRRPAPEYTGFRVVRGAPS